MFAQTAVSTDCLYFLVSINSIQHWDRATNYSRDLHYEVVPLSTGLVQSAYDYNHSSVFSFQYDSSHIRDDLHNSIRFSHCISRLVWEETETLKGDDSLRGMVQTDALFCAFRQKGKNDDQVKMHFPKVVPIQSMWLEYTSYTYC